jgi:hypothetical protein
MEMDNVKRKIVALFMIMLMALTVTTVAVTAKPTNVTSTQGPAAPIPPRVSAAQGSSANAKAPALAGWTEAGASALCWDNNGNFFFFTRGTDGALWYDVWNSGTWSAWQSLGGVLTSDPSVACQINTNVPSVTITVFVRGTNGAVYDITTMNDGVSWSNWHPLGGQIASGTGPGACSWSQGRLDLFVEGTNGALYHKWSTDGGTSWSGWQNLGGVLTSSPAACAWSANRVDVFARGANGALWHKAWTGTTWSTWQSLGGVIMANTAPGACSWGSGRLDVFVQGTDSGLWHKWYSGNSWSGWENVSGLSLTSSPAAAVWPQSTTIDVYVLGPSGVMWENSYSQGFSWSGWTNNVS